MPRCKRTFKVNSGRFTCPYTTFCFCLDVHNVVACIILFLLIAFYQSKFNGLHIQILSVSEIKIAFIINFSSYNLILAVTRFWFAKKYFISYKECFLRHSKTYVRKRINSKNIVQVNVSQMTVFIYNYKQNIKW